MELVREACEQAEDPSELTPERVLPPSSRGQARGRRARARAAARQREEVRAREIAGVLQIVERDERWTAFDLVIPPPPRGSRSASTAGPPPTPRRSARRYADAARILLVAISSYSRTTP
jgi:hypothetical protein